MKVVLFCGGLGMRLREYSDSIPKPMVNVGSRPLLWHLMKYYAHFGHKDFILCLGHKADYIKNYFLNYEECLSNDFVLEGGRRKIELLNKDISDWRITFTFTGAKTNIGGRLMAAREFVRDEEMFLANYTDNLSDVHLPALIDSVREQGAVAGFLAVRPNVSYHFVETSENGQVSGIEPADTLNLWSNGGFFVLRKEIFDYMRDGEELVEEPFKRLIAEKKLLARKHEGFWACMDTFKEKQFLDDLVMQGSPPWELWDSDDIVRKPSPTEVEHP